MVVFWGEGKPVSLEKTSRCTYDARSGIRTRATLTGGECSHQCTIPAPQKALHLSIYFIQSSQVTNYGVKWLQLETFTIQLKVTLFKKWILYQLTSMIFCSFFCSRFPLWEEWQWCFSNCKQLAMINACTFMHKMEDFYLCQQIYNKKEKTE